MRIAVVADIHGNVRALRAVMDDIKTVSPDTVVNLGDCVSGPLEAAETCDVLISLAWRTPGLERRKAGEPWHLTFRVVSYDWNAASGRAAAKGREDWARWIKTGY